MLTIVHTNHGLADTIRDQIDGHVMDAMSADIDRDSFPELYVMVQSAGSGSYARLLGYQFEQTRRLAFGLPPLDRRQSAGYMGHDTLWIQDSVLVRRFPVYTEGDFNASASGGTRTLEYVLQRNQDGSLSLQCSRILNEK